VRRGERGKIKKKYGGRLKSYTKNGLSKYDNIYMHFSFTSNDLTYVTMFIYTVNYNTFYPEYLLFIQ